MSCDEFRPFIGAYVDGEFDERETAEMEAHLASCSECRELVQREVRCQKAFRETMPDSSAPEDFKEDLMASLEEEAEQKQSEKDEHERGRSAWQYAAASGSLAAGVALVMWFVPSMTVAPASSGQQPVVEQTIDWHQEHLPVEISGPGSKQVKTWFRDKVDFPVRLPEFNQGDVRLIGGRLAHVHSHRAAYLAYEVQEARLSVMMFRGDDFEVPSQRVQSVAGREVALLDSEGYGVAVMRDDGVTYTITSDVPQRELVDIISSTLEQ
jgi:anti-sigma factor RsiW